MGIAIVIPSGMLWNAIARDRDIPKDLWVVVVIKVAIPSGMLCIIIAIIDIIPTLYKECFLVLVVDIFFSKKLLRVIPIISDIKVNVITVMPL